MIGLANASGHGDSSGLATNLEDFPDILIDQYGRVHFAWMSTDHLGDTIGTDYDILHARTLLPIPPDNTDGFLLR